MSDNEVKQWVNIVLGPTHFLDLLEEGAKWIKHQSAREEPTALVFAKMVTYLSTKFDSSLVREAHQELQTLCVYAFQWC